MIHSEALPATFERRARRWAAVGTLVGAACGAGGGDATTSGPTAPAAMVPARLTATGEATLSDSVGAARAVAVRVTTATGAPVPNAVVTFAASVGSVTPTSVNTGADGSALATWTLDTRPGTATLTATSGALPAVTFAATVGPAAPSAMAAAAALPLEGRVGDALDVAPAVVIRDRHGNAVPNVAVIFSVAAGGGTLSAGAASTGAQGVASVATWTLGTAAGPQRVVAAAGALKPVEFVVTARPDVAARVVAAPRAALLTDIGDTVRLRAVAADRFGNATPDASATWRSLDAAVVAVEPGGLVRARGAGTARVVASIATAADTVAVNVTPEPVASVEVAQRPAWLLVGDTMRVAAVPRGASGRALQRTVRWTTSDGTVATVDTGGLVRVLAPGTATVAAAVDGITGRVAVTTAPGGGVRVPALAAIDSAVIEYLRREAIPGAQVGVLRNGRLVFLRGYGWADVQARRPVAPDALFRIGSVSKPVAAVAVLQLVGSGRLRLDDRPFTMLADLSVLPGEREDPRLGTITVRNLLNQAGGWDGVTRAVDYRVWEGTWRYGVRDAGELVRHGRGVPLVDPPGTRYAYTNYATQVLGRVVERVTGQAFEGYVRANVLGPQGITRMRFGHSALSRRDPAEVRYHDANGHPVDGDGGAMENWDAAGRWIASAADLMRVVNGIEGRNGPPALLSPAMIAAMTERPAAIWPGAGGCHYAAFWWVCPDRGGQSWNHSGAPEGGHALLERRGDGSAFVILVNKERPSITLNLRPLLDAVGAWPAHDLFVGTY